MIPRYDFLFRHVHQFRYLLPMLLVGWLRCHSALFAQSTSEPGRPVSANPTARSTPLRSPSAGLNTATGELPSFKDLFFTAPVINGIILSLSILAVLLFVFFLITVNTRTMLPPSFADDVTKMVLRLQYAQAAEHCRRNRHRVGASILERCLENADKDPRTRMSILQSEGQRRAELIWNRISYLIDISNLAPMLGLLGTVYGMLQAFFVLPSTSASLNSSALAKAIGTAMTATFFGIAVAILATVFHTIIKSRATHALAEIEQLINSITDHIDAPTTTSVAAPPPSQMQNKGAAR